MGQLSLSKCWNPHPTQVSPAHQKLSKEDVHGCCMMLRCLSTGRFFQMPEVFVGVFPVLQIAFQSYKFNNSLQYGIEGEELHACLSAAWTLKRLLMSNMYAAVSKLSHA